MKLEDVPADAVVEIVIQTPTGPGLVAGRMRADDLAAELAAAEEFQAVLAKALARLRADEAETWDRLAAELYGAPPLHPATLALLAEAARTPLPGPVGALHLGGAA